MIAKGLRPMIWVAGVGASALGLYMVSLKVAAERAELTALERRIVHTRASIRGLQTELGTRGRLQQLEQWNSEVLALSTPGAGQFLDSNVSLAHYDVEPRATPVEAPLRQVASPSAQPVGQSPIRQAAATDPAPALPSLRQALATQTPTRTQNGESPAVRSALLVPGRRLVAEARPISAPDANPPTRPAATSRPSSLLDESTLRDLNLRSRGERDGGARN